MKSITIALASLILLLTTFSQLANATELNLPNMGDPSESTLSPTQADKLGKALLRQLRQEKRIAEDPLINSYVSSLGFRLATSSSRPSEPFTFFVVDDASINAFAAPGGYIGIHTGLIETSSNESELAAVMAHEIAHVTQRHMARAFENAGQMKLPMAIALLTAVLLGSQSAELGEAAVAVASAGSIQQQINFTRSNESEADAIGMETLANAGFDPHGMESFFKHLQHEARYYGVALPEYLRTHPISESRIAESKNRADRYPQNKYTDRLSFSLIRARLKAINESDPHKATRYFESQLRSGQHQNRDAFTYGQAIALIRDQKPKKAVQIIEELLNSDPDRLEYLLALANAEMEQNNYDRSLAILSDAESLYPGSYPLVIDYSRALITTGNSMTAVPLLKNQINHQNDKPQLHQLYAEALGKTGKVAEAHVALAQYLYLNEHLISAIEQLKQAKKLAVNDHYLLSRIESKLIIFKESLAEMKKSEKKRPK
ncbi:hypothetical protein BOW53_08880 [Solemya pervernicosa gill symbiont]|uniref:Putative beta-barrel assembly-enhancing protease n=2 Tax=Gammaproteobacteria incertae sedis TaxID=118884 RepID=A0A1T2L4Y5_9GAMM|nr:M48 family metalloprotease [Candidatus Reidiella endopervernicosa]OOZ40132.1 hypothetical protein BOW53_08880 [Solemya pervernicosa gill symbiont]QKQ27458.1 M48 family metallopeptidase [Candidatus Reidiella endopervernicosa]